MNKITNRIRLIVQVCFSAVSNGYLYGFINGTIYRGPLKAVCVPGLNCYSCPGALGSCPIGSLQAVLNDRNYKFAFYITGLLIMFGSVFGRFVCGWLCPFGLLQDLLYKIPFVKKVKNLPGHRYLVWLKYVILAVFVILLPMFAVDFIGQGKPWFCKYICPSGTLGGGIPLLITNEPLRSAIGFLYYYKVGILVVLILLSIAVYRPFCKYLCPLGAFYGMFNPVSLTRLQVDREKCTECGLCQKVCKMDIRVFENPVSAECIRCGDCVKACPEGALYNRKILKK